MRLLRRNNRRRPPGSADGDVLSARPHGQIKALQVRVSVWCERRRSRPDRLALRAPRRCCWVDLQAARRAVDGGVMVGGRSSRMKVADLERQGSSGWAKPWRFSRGESWQELVAAARVAP